MAGWRSEAYWTVRNKVRKGRSLGLKFRAVTGGNKFQESLAYRCNSRCFPSSSCFFLVIAVSLIVRRGSVSNLPRANILASVLLALRVT